MLNKRSIISVLLICAMLFSLLPCFPAATAYAAPVSGWYFNQDGNFEGWAVGADLTSPSVSNGILQFITSGIQPRTNYVTVNLNAGSVPYLNIKVRKSPVNTGGENLKVYFTTSTSTTPDETKTVPVPFYTDGNWHVYSLNMAANVKWSGTIKSIRLVFGNITNSTVAIDSVYFTSAAESDISPAAKAANVMPSRESGEVSPGTSISLSASDFDSRIYYTIDGSDPITSGTRQYYQAPLSIQSDTTIKAYAKCYGMTDSDVSTFNYTIPVVSAVQANPAPGFVQPGTSVELSSATVSAAVYYTLDGSDPKTSATRVQYSSPIGINANATIIAYAVVPGMVDSLTNTFVYVIRGNTAPVVANPASGPVVKGTKVELSTETVNASVYYTTDETDPRVSSSRQLYAQPIEINSAMTIKAYASSPDNFDSDVSTFAYSSLPGWYFNQDGNAEGWSAAGDFTPFTITGGRVKTATTGIQPRTNYQTIQWNASSIPYFIVKMKKNPINRSGEKLKLYFTTDQETAASETKTVTANVVNDPYWHIYTFDMTSNSLWTGTIKTVRLTFQNTVNGDVEIDSMYFSPVPVADVPPNIDVIAAPGGGVVPMGTPVALTSGTPGAVIYYTLDGSDPVESATHQEYTGPIIIQNNTTIKAYSESLAAGQSEVSIYNYIVVNKTWNFEGSLEDWKTVTGSLEAAPLEGRDQTSAMKININNVTSGYSASNRYDVSGDTFYTFEAYFNIPGGLQGLPYYGRVGLNIVEFSQDGTPLIIDTKYDINTTNGWALLSMTIKTKPATSQVQLRITATGTGAIYVDNMAFREATALEHKRLREYSGTLSERVILNGTDALPVDKPMTVNVGTEVPAGETIDFNMNLFWENESAYYPGPYRGGFMTLFPKPDKTIDYVCLWLRVNTVIGTPTIELRFRELGEITVQDVWSKTINLSQYAGLGWTYVQIPKSEFQHTTSSGSKGEPDFNNIERLYTLIDGPQDSKVDLNMAGLRLGFADGTKMMIIDPDRGDFQFDVDAHPEWSNPVDGTGKVVIGMNTRYMSSDKGRQTLVELRDRLFPNLFISGNTCLNYISDVRNWLNDRQIGVGLQMGHSFGLNNTLTRTNAWGYNFSGESRNITPGEGGISQANHGNDYLSPDYINAFKSAIAKTAGLKISEIQIIDHRITVMNGELAHSEIDRANYREMLKETDPGIELKKINGTTETIKFWEYFRRFNGFTYTPAEAGLNDWSEYSPLTAGKIANGSSSSKDRINYYIFIHLLKYALTQVTQEFGVYADEVGTDLSVIPVGEGYNNGLDPVALYQGTHLPIISWEFFRSPLQVKDLYMESKYITASTGMQNKNLRLVTEIGHNGGGSPYYAPELAYITHYDATASLKAKSIEVDFLEDSFYDRAFDRVNYPSNFARTLDVYQKGVAFNHAYADQAAINNDQNQVVILRRPGGNFIRSEEPYQLYNAIRALNVPSISMKHEEFEALSGDAKVLVNDYSAQPHDLKARLLNWIDGTAGRALVMHSFGPGAKMSGTNYSTVWNWNWSEMTDPGYYTDVLGSDLGVDTTKGKAGAIATSIQSWADIIPSTLAADIPGGLYTGGGSEVVVTLNGDPLVSRSSRPNGNYVYYLHYKPNQTATAELDKRIMEAIFSTQGVRSATDDTDGLVVNGYTRNDDVFMYTIYDTSSLSGTPDVFPYLAPNVARTFKVKPEHQAAEWLVYDILKDTLTETTKAADGSITLSLNGVSSAMQYLVPKQGDWKSKITGLRIRRAEVYKLLEPDVASPEVTGVENGASYNQDVTIRFNEGTATLNGQGG